MKSIRKYAYAAVLMLNAFCFAPGQVSAQDAGGSFTLAHEVHWQNDIVPAGDYRFSVEPRGPGEMLTLHRLNGRAETFMLLAADVDSFATASQSQLLVITRVGGRFVQTMQLPEIGVTLHFSVPAERHEVAQAAPLMSTVGATR